MAGFKELKKSIDDILGRLQELLASLHSGKNPFSDLASLLLDLRSKLDQATLSGEEEKEADQLDRKLSTVIDQLSGRASATSTDRAEQLIGTFIAAHQDVVSGVDQIRQDLETVKTTTKILGYLDKLVEIAAAIAKSA